MKPNKIEQRHENRVELGRERMIEDVMEQRGCAKLCKCQYGGNQLSLEEELQ